MDAAVATPLNQRFVNNMRPLWRSDVQCHVCYACLNYCPEEAVQIRDKIYMKSYTQRNPRYPHPWATAEEIAAQKRLPADDSAAP